MKLETAQLPSREIQIQSCVAKCRRRCPEIVPSVMKEHKTTGQRHSVFGMPFNFNPEDYKTVIVGYCFRDQNGTTYGQREQSPEALRAKFESAQDKTCADFRRCLEEMSSTDLERQFKFWETQK